MKYAQFGRSDDDGTSTGEAPQNRRDGSQARWKHLRFVGVVEVLHLLLQQREVRISNPRIHISLFFLLLSLFLCGSCGLVVVGGVRDWLNLMEIGGEVDARRYAEVMHRLMTL